MNETITPTPDAPATRAQRSPARALLIVLGAAGLLFGAGAVASSLLRSAEGVSAPLGADPGNRVAPAISLETLDGKPMTLASLRGKPVVLNFWASWCVTCKEEGPVLARGSREWGAKGVYFLGVDTRDGKGYARAFLKEYGLEYENLFDATGQVERAYGVTGFPETFFIDRAGVIKGKWLGPLTDERLAELVGLILVDTRATR